MAVQGDQPQIVYLFASLKKMDIGLPDLKQRTPLHWAIHNMSKLSLEYILAYDQNLEIRDSLGHTPLHKAILMQSKERDCLIFVKTLIIRGANKKSLTIDGMSC